VVSASKMYGILGAGKPIGGGGAAGNGRKRALGENRDLELRPTRTIRGSLSEQVRALAKDSGPLKARASGAGRAGGYDRVKELQNL